MPPEPTPAWYAKPFTLSFPAGIIAVVASILAGSVAAGGVGLVAQNGDVAALGEQIDARVDVQVDARIDTRLEAVTVQLRRETAASDAASEALARSRYEEILRRLDRIERRVDEGVAR